MPRPVAALILLAFLLCVGAAYSVQGAPAPQAKPRKDGDWVTGWDKPVNPVGGCQFDRSGRKLTIRMASEHSYEPDFHDSAWSSVTHLSRDVEGDFDAQFRITSAIKMPKDGCQEGDSRSVGLFLHTGGVGCYLQRESGLRTGRRFNQVLGNYMVNRPGVRVGVAGSAVQPELPMILRVSRRGDCVTMAAKEGGHEWIKFAEHDIGKLPRMVKIGVFAIKIGNTPFEVVFDEFVLTPHRKP